MERAMKKGICIAIVILTCFIIGTGWIAAVSNTEKNERATITSISVESIAEKFQNEDGYYLTVVLDDSMVEAYHLSYDRISLKTGQRIYDKILPEDNFAGVSLKITGPEKRSNADLGLVLKEKQDGFCEIISVTKADNSLIDET